MTKTKTNRGSTRPVAATHPIHSTPISEREQFCAVLSSGPLLQADAVVVPSGDGETRIWPAIELFRQGAAPVIVVTGGLHNPPHSLLASDMADLMVAKGVAPDRLLVDNRSQNTQEQAAFVIGLVQTQDWHRLILVASPYHTFRVFLTFLKALQNAGLDRKVHLVNMPASQAPWWGKPAGLGSPRVNLLADEFAKIDRYGAEGHVASYADGLAYLKFWETPVAPKKAAA